MEITFIKNMLTNLHSEYSVVKYLLYGFIIISTIYGFSMLYSNRAKDNISLIGEILHKHIWNQIIAGENVKKGRSQTSNMVGRL